VIYDPGRCMPSGQIGLRVRAHRTEDCSLNLWFQKVRRSQDVVCESHGTDGSFKPEDAVQAYAQRDLAWFHGLVLYER